MKLHLPKALFTAVMALFAISPAAYALTVNEVTSITYDSFATDGSATTMPDGVTYDASTGVLTGIDSSNVWFTLNTNALTAENAGGHVIYVTATENNGSNTCSWGINTDAAGTGLAGYWSPNVSDTNPSGTWTEVTLSAEKIDELNGDGSEIIMRASITATNSGTHLYDVDDNDIFSAGKLKTTTYTVDTLTLNNKYISSVLYNVVRSLDECTITNADGTFTRTYAGDKVSVDAISSSEMEATLIHSKSVQITGKTASVTNIAKGGDIIIGKSGNLFLQTWNGNNGVTDADILIENDIYIGSTTNGYGALRTADFCGDVIINGDITLIEDALFTKEEQPSSGERGTDTIINGKLSGDYTLSVKSSNNNKDFDDIVFAGEIDLKGLTIAANGTGGADFTISGTTAIDKMTVDADTIITKSGDNSMTFGAEGAQSTTDAITIHHKLEFAGSGIINVNGAIRGNRSVDGEFIVGEDLTVNADLFHASWSMPTIQIDGKLNVDTFNLSTDDKVSNVSGAGTIQAGSFNMGNTGTYNINEVRIEVGADGVNTTANGAYHTVYVGDATFAATTDSWTWNTGTDLALADETTGTTFEVAEGKTITIGNSIINKVVSVTEGEGESATTTQVTTAGKLVKTGKGTLVLGGSNNTYTGETVLEEGTLELKSGKLASSISGAGNVKKSGDGDFELTVSSTYSGGTSIEGGKLMLNADNALGTGAVDVKNGSTLQLNYGKSLGNVSSINLSGNSTIRLENGNSGTLNSTINVDGTNKIEAGHFGNSTEIQGAITGAGTLELKNISDNVWRVSSTISDKSADGTLKVVNTNSNAILAGNNTYTGGTEIAGGVLSTASESALGAGKVTVKGGTLKQDGSALKVTELEYQSGTVNNNGQALEVGSLTVGSTPMAMAGNGTTTVTDTLTVSNTNAFTMEGALVLTGAKVDLSGFTVDTTTTQDTYVYTLGTAAGGINADASISYTGFNVDGYTAELVAAAADPTTSTVMLLDGAATNNYLVLTLTKVDDPDTLTSLNVTGATSYADGVLTLTTDVDDVSAVVFGDKLAASMTDAVWNEIVGEYDLDALIGVSFTDANGQVFDFDGANNDGTAPIVTINGEGTTGAQLLKGAGTVVGNYTTAYIPEPTTTTLSLLALAALAVRRRRK